LWLHQAGEIPRAFQTKLLGFKWIYMVIYIVVWNVYIYMVWWCLYIYTYIYICIYIWTYSHIFGSW
jgi:hypothetical protein